MDEIRLIERLEQPTLGVRQVVRWDEIGDVFGRVIPAVAQALQHLGAVPAGAPYARYRGHFDDSVDLEVGFPVVEPVDVGAVVVDLSPGEVVADPLPAVRAAESVHTGAYDGLRETYTRMEAWVAEHHLDTLDQSWEIYESGPESDPDPATWRTRVLLPVTGPAVGAR
ncbi:GyrI-like domain-containing protein [Cellulomonas sp. ATA003]|uniref:GyrI-like domain-containing protein n=1 Tax=Cellulomonas sp. ATA003 TaxID=3073064 RepID=UPI002873BA4F|nr:GyrI-like domain-containing protein [Cellulomonas sp. ATA003]WNB86957.1 GyrI-like domain-containing protein [Cellulomonas sp. ATA003]